MQSRGSKGPVSASGYSTKVKKKNMSGFCLNPPGIFIFKQSKSKIMKHLFILFILFLTTVSSSAQIIKAITQHGETVVLFENGTWKYEKELQDSITSAKTPIPVTVLSLPPTTIDNNKEVTSDKTTLFNAVSNKLARFFGEEKGRIRCSVSATNSKGEIAVNFEFIMPVGDANRYFGDSSADCPISLVLANGTVLNSTFTKNIEEKFDEKWNVSCYKASIVLTTNEVNQLLQSNAVRLSVNWKKTKEDYTIEQPGAIKEILGKII